MEPRIVKLPVAVAASVLWMALSPPSGASRKPESRATQPPPRILNLYDSFGYGKKGTTLDWGYSALVEYDGKTILFDSGSQAEVLAHNAKALGVDLAKVDIAVLSPARRSRLGVRLPPEGESVRQAVPSERSGAGYP